MYRLSNICGSCHVVVGQPSHSYGTTVTQLCVSCHTMQIAICCVRRATVAGYFFSPRPQRLDDRTHPLITLANPLRSLCALCGFAREEQLPRDIFLAKAAKTLMTLLTLAHPLRSLCALCGFAREEQLSRDNFSRQAAKTLMTLLTLANPLRSLCASAALREKSNCSGIIFLAKPQRSQRRSMNIFATTFHDLCSLSLA